MMPAAKHGDMQIGVDIHLCMVPPGVPTPLPTPHMSVVFDPFDYVPIIGATVTVCGMKRATAGTSGKVVHIPPGFPFAPKMPDTEDEIFMGSATVDADGDPFSHIAHPVLACQMVGMVSPFRKKKKGGPRAMVLPTVFNLAIPTTVFIGGPPTISLMGLAVKGAFSALGKLAKSKVFKRIRQKVFKNMKPGFLKCTILRAEPVNILDGSVSIEQKDFSLPGCLPIDWIRTYSSSDLHVGLCGKGWQTLADIRLEVDPTDGSVLMQAPGAGPLSFDRLPTTPGNADIGQELCDGASLTDEGDAWLVKTKNDRMYHFPKSLASRDARGLGIAPIGSLSDRCGNSWTFEYRDGFPEAVTDPTGRKLLFTIRGGRLLAVTLIDAPERLEHGFVRYEYDEVGSLSAAIDALGGARSFAYTSAGLVRHTDRTGLSFHYEYALDGDGSPRVVRTWGDGDLYHYRFEYVEALNERRITDSLGQVSTVKLGESGLPISEIDPLGGITVFEYDASGRTTAVVDPGGRRTSFSYDSAGNVLGYVRPDGAAIQTTFEDNKPIAITDPMGRKWLQQWDRRGLLIEQVSPEGHITRYEYDDRGQLTALINPRKAKTRFGFDHRGNLVELVDTLGRSTRFAYDQLGNVVARRDALGVDTRYRYDAKSRLAGVDAPSGKTIELTYDAQDRLTGYTDEAGATTRLEYFGQGEVCRRSQPDGFVVEYRYDTEERLIGVRNQRGETHELLRDALGRVVAEVDYWGQQRRYAYDAAGRLLAMEDALGRRIDYETDILGRVVSRSFQDLHNASAVIKESYCYDANGNLIEASGPSARIAREYDAEGKLLSEEQHHSDGEVFTIRNSYDDAGNRTRREIARLAGGGHTVEFVHDLSDRDTGFRIDGGQAVLLQRDALGRPTRQWVSDAFECQQAYDVDGFLSQQGIVVAGSVAVATTFTYDAAGNLNLRDDSVQGTSRYRHDPAGRLIEHLDPHGQVRRWLNDPAGDRLVTRAPTEEHTIGTIEDGEDSGVQRWLRQGSFEDATYQFDRAGNLVRKLDHGDVLNFSWDACNRLCATRRTPKVGPSSTTVYGYDPLGRRVFKQAGDRRISFAWDDDAIALDVDQGRVREFVHRPGTFEPLALIDDSVHLYVNDPNGCPTRLLDMRGQVEWAATYDAWGSIAQLQTSAVDNPLRLQGQYHDPETGMNYNRNRYYLPEVGQFASADPLGLKAGSNPYQYAFSALRGFDPLGLMPWVDPVNVGHHLVPQSLARSTGPGPVADLLGSNTNTPTFFFSKPYVPSSHEAIHAAQRPHIGKLQGSWAGTADELLAAAKAGLGDVGHIKGDLMIPSTGQVLAKDVTPAQAFDKLMEWFKKAKQGC